MEKHPSGPGDPISSRGPEASLRRNPVWPILGYTALGLIALARRGRVLRHDRGGMQLDERARGSPATGAFGMTRSSDEPRHVQHERAHESGRGRHATAPWQFPWVGWKDVLWRTYQQISEDRLLAVAAGVVFYGLLALFPAITALVSLYGLFATPSSISDHLSIAAGLLPTGAFDIFQEQVNRIIEKSGGKLSFAFIFGLGLALSSANAGIGDSILVLLSAKPID